MKTKNISTDIHLIADLNMDEEAHRDEIDAFITRNREALNAALAVAYNDIKRGRCRTLSINEILTAGERHYRENVITA
jgi:hypothetical protein